MQPLVSRGDIRCGCFPGSCCLVLARVLLFVQGQWMFPRDVSEEIILPKSRHRVFVRYYCIGGVILRDHSYEGL